MHQANLPKLSQLSSNVVCADHWLASRPCRFIRQAEARGVTDLVATAAVVTYQDAGGDGSSKEDDLRQKCEGTLIQLLDQFEPVQKYHVRHTFHIQEDRDAHNEYDRNSIPGMIDCKSDFSENGSLEKAKQLQSEYWIIIYYTLLISIASFLVASVWREHSSVLPAGAAVTVEPKEYEPPECT